MFATSFTTLHTLISLAAIVIGLPAVAGLVRGAAHNTWITPFLVLAILTTGTGFLFPFNGVTPAFATGIVAGIILIFVVVARYARHLAGGWRRVDALGIVASLYLLVFVLIAQLFNNLPALQALAPTGSEPPFAIAQGVCLALFVWLGWRTWRVGGRRLLV